MKILCFGDSNTYGYDPHSFFGGQYPAQYRWVDLLAQKLPCTTINAGENGQEIPSRKIELQRFHLLVDRHKPIDLLTIMLGYNDLLQGNSVDTIIKRMEAFLKCVDLERSKILLISPPAMCRGEWVYTQMLIDSSEELRTRFKTLSGCLGVRFVDAGMWNIPITFDGVHFSEDGHIAFAEGLVNYLNKGD